MKSLYCLQTDSIRKMTRLAPYKDIYVSFEQRCNEVREEISRYSRYI